MILNRLLAPPLSAGGKHCPSCEMGRTSRRMAGSHLQRKLMAMNKVQGRATPGAITIRTNRERAAIAREKKKPQHE